MLEGQNPVFVPLNLLTQVTFLAKLTNLWLLISSYTGGCVGGRGSGNFDTISASPLFLIPFLPLLQKDSNRQ